MFEVITEDNQHHELKRQDTPNNQKKMTYDIYWSYEPTKHITETQKIGTLSPAMTGIQFELAGGDQRLYFQLIDKNTNQVFVLGHRRLPIKNMLNFRDLGGYPTEDGRSVKWGLLYRSDYFWNLADESLAYLKGLKIKTNIDYRTDEELSEHPNKDFGVERDIQCDTKAETAKIAGEMQSQNSSSEVRDQLIKQGQTGEVDLESAGDVQMLTEQRNYVNGAVTKKAFGKALKLIVNPSNLPANQHCRGGKDRTGYGVALTLFALGVPEEIIIRDYMLTKFYRRERNAFLLSKYREQYSDEAVINYLYSFFDIKESFMEESIKEIKKNYPTVVDYIINELGISLAEIQAFRDYCLE